MSVIQCSLIYTRMVLYDLCNCLLSHTQILVCCYDPLSLSFPLDFPFLFGIIWRCCFLPPSGLRFDRILKFAIFVTLLWWYRSFLWKKNCSISIGSRWKNWITFSYAFLRTGVWLISWFSSVWDSKTWFLKTTHSKTLETPLERHLLKSSWKVCLCSKYTLNHIYQIEDVHIHQFLF